MQVLSGQNCVRVIVGVLCGDGRAVTRRVDGVDGVDFAVLGRVSCINRVVRPWHDGREPAAAERYPEVRGVALKEGGGPVCSGNQVRLI